MVLHHGCVLEVILVVVEGVMVVLHQSFGLLLLLLRQLTNLEHFEIFVEGVILEQGYVSFFCFFFPFLILL